MIKYFFLFLIISLSGCTIGHKKFYDQVAPSKYPPTSNVMIFEYRNVDLDEIYELLFSDFLVIGTSGFNGPYEDPSHSKSFAESIGADVLIASSQFKETKTSFMNLSTPTSSTTYINAYSGSGSAYGTATTYGTKTTTVPISVNRYDQDGIFLKNINNIIPLWERTKNQYKRTSNNPLSGIWENESYRIELYQSGEQLVAFVSEVIGGNKSWSKDQMKMVFGIESGVGIYLMGNKSPIPSRFKVNKFGHLEVELLTSSDKFTFAKNP